MEVFGIVEKYRKLMKKEKKYNYKYNPILNSKKKKIIINNNSNSNKKTKKLPNLKVDHLQIKEDNPNDINNNNNKQLKRLFSEEFINNTIKKKQPKENITISNKINELNAHLYQFRSTEMPIITSSSKYNINNIKPIESSKNNDILDSFTNHHINHYFPLYKKNKIKGYFTKNRCPFCKNVLLEEENNKKLQNKSITESNNIYRNKKFKDIKSCFIYSVNNFPLLHSKENKNKKNAFMCDKYNDDDKYVNKYYKTQKLWNHKNVDMESDLTKYKKIIKVLEIQRKEFDPSDLYLVKKPLIPTIRGKISKNMKKRFFKPMRIIYSGKHDNFISYNDMGLKSIVNSTK